jgi:transglutaminase-like putative cysteine protease
MTDEIFYQVDHETRYTHSGRASTSQHVAHLTPRELPYQRVREHAITTEPGLADLSARTDFFGNAVRQFTIGAPYRSLRVVTHSVVQVLPRRSTLDLDASVAWEQARDALKFQRHEPYAESSPFSYGSPYASPSAELRAFARDIFVPGCTVLAGAIELMHRIYREFTFDSSATTIATPLSKVLSERRGVCQDFAHLQVACLRSFGLAARYVSGYLLTNPPPGRPRLVGSDASHAWLAVCCPRIGWVDLDPTNDAIPDVRHITLGWGRDFGDVSPLRGVVLGGGAHSLRVAVSVIPLAPPE